MAPCDGRQIARRTVGGVWTACVFNGSDHSRAGEPETVTFVQSARERAGDGGATPTLGSSLKNDHVGDTTTRSVKDQLRIFGAVTPPHPQMEPIAATQPA